MPWTSDDLKSAYPTIEWRTPLPVQVGDVKAFGCRICIAIKGLKGTQVKDLPKTTEDFEHP